VFRAYYGIRLKTMIAARARRSPGRMVLLDNSFADAPAAALRLPRLADPQRPAPTARPEARQRQIIAVMRQVIQSVSEEQPTVTLVEDLHWLDDAAASSSRTW